MASRRLVSLLVTMLGIVAAIALTGQPAEAQRDPPPRRYKFTIDPGTPIKDLLPTPPRTPSKLPAYLNDDLALVAELTFGEPVAMDTDAEKATAHIIAKINHLNQDERDGFVKALSGNRADLHGLPFLMGNDCRTEKQHAQLFTETVEVVRALVRNINLQEPEAASIPNAKFPAEIVFREFPKALSEKRAHSHRSRASRADLDRAHVAGLMQMFATQPALYRVGLAKYLATVENNAATQALAKLAIFAPEESVQNAAIDGLKGRPANAYADALLQGFHYPLPAVSQRAADALVKLQCRGVLADLVTVLEQPDPRAPAKQKFDGKDVKAVRELVRLNHRRNCLLCHAPANTVDVPKDVLTVPVPLPTNPTEGYYFQASPDIFVRTDVTYLRQDFSLMMKVENAKPWPEIQRFDFFVRTRIVTATEAADYEKQVAKWTPPSHAAAQYALRELTGQTRDLTAAEWRRLLK